MKIICFTVLQILVMTAWAQMHPLDGGEDLLADYRGNQELQQKVDKTVAYAKLHIESHSTMWCYHYVKEDLLLGEDLCGGNTTTELPKRGSSCGGNVASLLHAWPDGASAYMAVEDLKAAPFKMLNLLEYANYHGMATNPEEIPRGAVVVYSNGASDGHVELKAEDGESHYYSDFDDETDFLHTQWGAEVRKPRSPGHPYKIIGVMIPTE